MNNTVDEMEQTVEDRVTGQEGTMRACEDLYGVLRRLAHMTDLATAHEAAAALRDACVQGRVYGMSYGYTEERGDAAGQYIGCALAHLGHTADPLSYEGDNHEALGYLMNYPHYGAVLEEYVMYIPRGARPQDNQYLANITNWLDAYLAD